MQTVWRSFTSSHELVANIDITAPPAPRAIVSTRRGLKRFLCRRRSEPDCTKGMKHALNAAIQSLGNDEPQSFEECVGRPHFGNDESRPVLRLVRAFFDQEEHDADDVCARTAEDDVDDADGDFEDAGFWKIRKAPSNNAKCMKCKNKIEAGSWRIELVAPKAVVSTQGGRGIAETRHIQCFFEWLGGGRRATTKGLRRLGDLEGIESVGEADKLQFQQSLSAAQNRFRERTSERRRAQPPVASSSSRPAAAPIPAVSPLSRTRPDRSAIQRGDRKSLLRMCRREQAGDELRRAVRDSVNDDNFDESTAPQDQLDFEVLVRSNHQPPTAVFLIERKSYDDLYASQRLEPGRSQPRLDSQLERLERAVNHTGRMLLVEVPDNAWKYDRVAEGYPEGIGVKTLLESLQCAYGELDGMGFPRVRVLRVRSQIETGQVMRALLKEALGPGGPDVAPPPRPGPRPHALVVAPRPSHDALADALPIAPVEANSPVVKRRRTLQAKGSNELIDSERARRRELAASQAELRAAAYSSRGTQSASSVAAPTSSASTLEQSASSIGTKAGRSDVVEVVDEETVKPPIIPASGTVFRLRLTGNRLDGPVDLD